MKAEDDPEARIRALEQPLAYQAHASELGSELGEPGNYSYPPPPPGPVPPPASSNMAPPPYGSSYGPGNLYRGGMPASSGTRWFWVLAAVGVVGVLALVGGIAAYAARQFAHGDLVVTSPTGSTSEVTTAPPGNTRNRPTPPTAETRAPSSAPSATVPAGMPVTVSGINENKTLACTDNVINISGITNNVVITGHCAEVNVSGMQNAVTVDSADAIDVSGLNNKVTYHAGSPKVSQSGGGNTVDQG